MTPCPANFNLAAYVLAAGRKTPDKTALQIIGQTTETWSYNDLIRAVEGTATGLLRHGLRPGDRILLRLGNTADFPIAFLAAIFAGLIPVSTSAQLTTEEITKLAQLTTPAAVLAEPGIALPAHPAPVLHTNDLADWRAQPAATPVQGDPNRPAYIIFTSGTSGQPRGVVHAHRAIWARRMMWDGWYGLKPDDRVMHAGAFNWTYTLGTGLLDPWAIGATALIPAQGTPANLLSSLMAEHGATIFAAAPGIYRQMLRSPVPALATLRHGLSAGEKLPEITRQHWETATNTPLHEAFGMSDAPPSCRALPRIPLPPTRWVAHSRAVKSPCARAR